MMSPEAIRSMSDEAAARAAREGKRPYVFWDDTEALDASKPLPLPFIGDYVPHGWERTGEEAFVDISGFGAEDKPAMTHRQFRLWLSERIRTNMPYSTLGYAITEVGQFQAFVAEYRRQWKDEA